MMKFTKLKIPDLVVCVPKILLDDRGYFMESFRHDELEKFLGYSVSFVKKMKQVHHMV